MCTIVYVYVYFVVCFFGFFLWTFFPSVLWYCWLGLLTCKNRLPYNLYCIGGDVKHCTIRSMFNLILTLKSFWNLNDPRHGTVCQGLTERHCSSAGHQWSLKDCGYSRHCVVCSVTAQFLPTIVNWPWRDGGLSWTPRVILVPNDLVLVSLSLHQSVVVSSLSHLWCIKLSLTLWCPLLHTTTKHPLPGCYW